MWNLCWMISCILCMCAARRRRQFCRCCRLRHMAMVTRCQNWRSGGASGASEGADISGWQYSRPFAFGSCIRIAAVTVIYGGRRTRQKTVKTGLDGALGIEVCCAGADGTCGSKGGQALQLKPACAYPSANKSEIGVKTEALVPQFESIECAQAL